MAQPGYIVENQPTKRRAPTSSLVKQDKTRWRLGHASGQTRFTGHGNVDVPLSLITSAHIRLPVQARHGPDGAGYAQVWRASSRMERMQIQPNQTAAIVWIIIQLLTTARTGSSNMAFSLSV